MNKLLTASLSILLFGGLAFLHLSFNVEKCPKKKPNVIFIFSDDQRYNSLSMTGDPVTQTPNIDQLATEGVFFNETYITSPICGPSRANIFTSQWERKNKIGFHYITKKAISKESFAQSWLMQLKNEGYSTAFIGKHHTKIVNGKNEPLNKEIDFSYYANGHIGFHLGRHKIFSNLKNRTQIEGFMEATKAYLKQDNEFDYFYKNANKDFKNNLNRRDKDKPFCAWINFNLPHASSIGGMGSKPNDPEFYRTLYNDKKEAIPFPEDYPNPISLPEEVYNQDDVMKYYKTSNKKRLLEKKLKMNRAVYAIDQYVGNIRKLLKEIGEDENTIIVFCSDNGLFLGEHGLGGKTILYDESVHVPFIIYSPFFKKKQTGKQVSKMIVGQDIPATILDLCGLDIPSSYQGKSVVPLIKGKKTAWREEVFLENLFTDQGYPRQEAVRDDKFKYIRSFSKKNDRKLYLPEQTTLTDEQPIYEELFDIKKDPKEANNLATNTDYAETLNHYRKRCKALVKECGK